MADESSPVTSPRHVRQEAEPGRLQRAFSPESTVIHAGTQRSPGAPATPPLVLASIFVSQGDVGTAHPYARDANPSWSALEHALGALEDSEAVVFGSGMAAAMALMLVVTKDRKRILVPKDGYYNIRKLAHRLLSEDCYVVEIDQLDLFSVKSELKVAPSVLWAETPTNPMLGVSDLQRLGELAADAHAPMVVDNTVATGFLQRPLEWGAIASLCSLTKSSSGHSDVILGAVTSRDQSLLKAIREWRSIGGGIPGPFETWLALRGLKTLHLRITQQSASALVIARHLAGNPRITAVHYPGVEPSTLDIVKRQMPRGYGPLLSFEVDGSASAADAVIAASQLILPATSFGGVESTWERRARHPSERAPDALIRLAVGIEPVADLITDIDQSLAVLH